MISFSDKNGKCLYTSEVKSNIRFSPTLNFILSVEFAFVNGKELSAAFVIVGKEVNPLDNFIFVGNDARNIAANWDQSSRLLKALWGAEYSLNIRG